MSQGARQLSRPKVVTVDLSGPSGKSSELQDGTIGISGPMDVTVGLRRERLFGPDGSVGSGSGGD